MKVARWGNSLAVRLPRSHVDALGLKEGDEVDIPPEAIRKVGDGRRAAALRRIEELSRSGPPGFRFDRDDIYDSLSSGFGSGDNAG
jgi:antitoxin MazE